MGTEIRISRLGRHFSGRDTVRAISGPSVVADNTLIIKQKSTLPVSKTRQDKSLFRLLSVCYLPPPTICTCVVLVGRGSIGLLSNNATVRTAVDEHWRVRASGFCPVKGAFRRPKAQEHSFVRRNAVTPDILPGIVGGIFWRKVPRVPCPARRPSVRPARSHSLPEERLLPDPPRHPPPPGVSLFRRFRCYLDPPHPAWPSAVSVSARCEPISAFPLLPGPSTSLA